MRVKLTPKWPSRYIDPMKSTMNKRRTMIIRSTCLPALVSACLFSLSARGQLLDAVTAQGRSLVQDFARSSLIIDTTGNACEHFEIFVAAERAAQARGLMFVREMPDEVGMLFIHPNERMISMWMKNTLLPLDMVFMSQSGTVTHIAENTVPGSLDTISSQQPALAILEINGGLAGRLGIESGNRVWHPFFESP